MLSTAWKGEDDGILSSFSRRLHERLKVFDRRTAMRYCRSFKTTAEIQPVLDFLEDYGYIAQMNAGFRPAGRPPLPRYAVNPKATEGFCHTVPVLSGKGGTGESVDL